MSAQPPYTAGDEIRFMRGLHKARRYETLQRVIELTLWRCRRFDHSVDQQAVEREALVLWERMRPAPQGS
jgi:hypothetical protein